MPSLRSKKNRFRKSLNTSPPGFSSSKSGAENCCVVDRAANRSRLANRLTPELGERAPIDLGEPHLQHHLLALAAAGDLQHVDDLAFADDAVAISPARSMTVVLDTWPDRMIASSLTLTAMSSPGNSVCSCCSSVVIAGSTTMSYCRRCRRPRRSG